MENNDNQKQNGDSKPNGDTKPVVVPMPLLQQTGKVYIGPGAEKEAQIIGLGLSKLSTRQKDDLDRAKRYAMEQSIKHVMMRQQMAHQEQQKKITMYSQALSLMARVYIGSISFEIREEQIKENFSVFGPIKSINMSWDTVTGHHKGFAFLEYEVPEAALLAQESMNGKLVGGRNLKVLPKTALKVGRPANMPQAQPIIEMVMQEAKDYNRVYVASVHPDLSEKDLRMVFEAFGKIIKCQLAKQPGKGHRGFGYLEFENAQAVREAIEGMNNFDLGGQHLQVGRCITPPDALTYIMPSSTQSALPTASAVAAAAVTAKIQAREAVAPKSSPNDRMSPSVASSSPVEASNSPFYDGGQASSSPMRSLSPNPNAFGADPTAGNPVAPAPSRRRLGGFAAAPVPSPSVANLPPPSIVQPGIVQPPGLAVPPIGLIPPIGVVSLKVEPKLEPVRDPSSYSSSYGPHQTTSYSSNFYGAVPPPPPEEEPPKPRVAENFAAPEPPKKKEKKDLISRIKLKEPKYEVSERATFAPLPENVAPKDKVEEEETANNGQTLAIEGSNGRSSSMALALREGAGELMKISKNDGKSTGKEETFRKKKKVKPPKEKQPKLNTPQALAAAEKAGAINDQMQAVQSQNEEATIASQENVEIRGNDARHLLMHKLMRTNRSSVIVIKNMVTADQVDDLLDEEIRSECGKHGTILGLVLAQDEDSPEAIRVFVKYAEPTQAEAARKALDKRYFDQKEISVLSYDQVLFDHGDYTG